MSCAPLPKLFLAMAIGGLVTGAIAQPARRTVVIATAGVTGEYQKLGVAICGLLNRRPSAPLCAVKSTGGSVENRRLLEAGKVDFAIMQADVYAQAVQHGSPVRGVMWLHPEPATLVVRGDVKGDALADLGSWKLNIGSTNSGERSVADALLASLGLTPAKTVEHGADRLVHALCRSKDIDAFFYTVGLKASSVEGAAADPDCRARLIPLEGSAVQRFVESKKPLYRMVEIPADTYTNQRRAVQTFAVQATLVTSDKTSADDVFALVRAVFDHLRTTKGQARLEALRRFEPEELLPVGMPAPVHPGARRYFDRPPPPQK